MPQNPSSDKPAEPSERDSLPIPATDPLLTTLSAAALSAYNDARMQGLCHEGALEIAQRIEQQLNSSARDRH